MASDSMDYEETWIHHQPPSVPPEVCNDATPSTKNPFLQNNPTTKGATVYHPSDDAVTLAEPTSYQPTDASMGEPTSYQPTDASMGEPTSYQPTDESMDYKPTIYQGGIANMKSSHLSSLQKQVPEEEFELKFKEGKKAGFALLIGNNKYDNPSVSRRPGAKKDMQNMAELFRRMNFEIDFLWDKTKAELIEQLEMISKNKDNEIGLKEMSMFVCVISTHGSEMVSDNKDYRLPNEVKMYEHCISMKDANMDTLEGNIKTGDLMDYFSDAKCRALRGKPKLYFIQSCRTRSDTSSPDKVYDRGFEIEVTTRDKDHVLDPKGFDPLTRMFDTMNVEKSGSAVKTSIDAPNESLTTVDTRGNMASDLKNTKGEIFEEHTLPKLTTEDTVSYVNPICLNNSLVMFASTEDSFAYSQDDTGGWLIKALHSTLTQKLKRGTRFLLNEALTELARGVAIDSEANAAGKSFSGCKAIPSIESKLIHEIFLPPPSMRGFWT